MASPPSTSTRGRRCGAGANGVRSFGKAAAGFTLTVTATTSGSDRRRRPCDGHRTGRTRREGDSHRSWREPRRHGDRGSSSPAHRGRCLTMHRDAGEEAIAPLDKLTPTQALVCARRLAPYRPAASHRWHQTPFDDGRLGGLDGSRRPCSRRPSGAMGLPAQPAEPSGSHRDLRARRGRGADIKEAARNGMGPHGLCVGATGRVSRSSCAH